MLFTRRTEPPTRDNEWYFDNNIFYQCDCGMPNCTAYAFGRANELTGRINDLSHSNAIEFWNYNRDNDVYPCGDMPRLGAIVVFNGIMINPKTNRPYGHVAVVEHVYPDNSFDTSESSWDENGGEYWYTDHYELDTEAHGGICGFIYYENFEESEGDTVNRADAENYVRTDYIEYLGRPADAEGLDTYATMLENDEITELELDAILQDSDEYQNCKGAEYKKWFIIKCYKAYLGRYPSDDEIASWSDYGRLRDIHHDIYFSEEAENRR